MQYISWQRGARNPATVKAGATMALREVKVISTGINSEVLRRSGRKAKHQQYLTLVGPERTLDLEMSSETERDMMM